MEVFIQQIINGLNTGSIYALIAIGYTMVYGVVRLINFAHGEIMMIGSFVAFSLATMFPGMPFLLIIILSMVFSALLGVLIEKIAYRKLRTAPRISALITAIGMSIFLQNAVLHLNISIYQDSKRRVFPKFIDAAPISIGNIDIPVITIFTIAMTIFFMVSLTYFVKKTKPGKAMRAVSQDKEAALLMGINVNNIISLTFAIGSALGALGGIFYSMAYGQVWHTMGVMPGLKAFVAAVLGGIGNIQGAMLGGYIIGIIENLVNGSKYNTWVDAVVFGILILLLLFKPSGILGKNVKEKV